MGCIVLDRQKKIVRVSIQGIIMNLFLVIFKGLVGLLANSIAIVLDALNNLSDMFSATVTIIGTKLSNKAPDREHPYGHGRIEYITAILIAVIIFLAGLSSLKESIVKIIEPVRANYAWYTIVVVILAIFIKFFFAGHCKKVGKEINSQSLIATGLDAYSDAAIAFSTLIGALISIHYGISIEGYLGILISFMIIKSAYEVIKETFNTMIGERPDSELTRKIKETINRYEEVQGVYDLMLHSYGPAKLVGSAHIEIDDDLTAKEIDVLTRRITGKIWNEYGIVFTLGIYALNDSGKAGEIKNYFKEIINNNCEITQLHGFYVDEEAKSVAFDLILDFNCKDQGKIKEEIIKKLNEKYPEYKCYIVLDSNISD